jgi:hypothetical protein
MKQQFIGLKHCKCGTSWSKDGGYFTRTNDMVFALERQVTKKSKNSVKVKQVPVIRYKLEDESYAGTKCDACKKDMLTADGCKPSVFAYQGNQYPRIKFGDSFDLYGDKDEAARCPDCNAKFGHYHHYGCDCEVCPVCGEQLISCGCDLHLIRK